MPREHRHNIHPLPPPRQPVIHQRHPFTRHHRLTTHLRHSKINHPSLSYSEERKQRRVHRKRQDRSPQGMCSGGHQEACCITLTAQTQWPNATVSGILQRQVVCHKHHISCQGTVGSSQYFQLKCWIQDLQCQFALNSSGSYHSIDTWKGQYIHHQYHGQVVHRYHVTIHLHVFVDLRDRSSDENGPTWGYALIMTDHEG